MASTLKPRLNKPPRRHWAATLLKSLTHFVVGFGFILVFVIAAAYFWRVPLVTSALRAGLDHVGLEAATFTLNDITLTRIELSTVTVGSELNIEEAKVKFKILRLPGNPVTHVSANGVRIDLTGKDKTLQNILMAGSGDTPPPTPQSIHALVNQIAPLPTVSVTNASLRFMHDNAPMTITGSFSAVPKENGKGNHIGGRIALRMKKLNTKAVEAHGINLDMPFHVALDEEQSRINLGLNTGALLATLRGAQPRKLDIVPLNLKISAGLNNRGELNATLTAPNVSVTEQGREGVIDDLAVKAKYANLKISGTVSGRLSAFKDGNPLIPTTPMTTDVSFAGNDISFRSKITLPGQNNLSVQGKHALSSQKGTASLKLSNAKLMDAARDLSPLFPTLKDMTVRSGVLQSSAAIRWGTYGTNGTASIKINGVNLHEGSSDLKISGLSADIRLSSLIPLRTALDQKLDIKSIAAGLPLNDLSLRFGLIKGLDADIPALSLRSFRTTFAGGTLNIAPTVIDAAEANKQAKLGMQNVDLATLFTAIGIDGVSGTGKLKGLIPVRMNDQTVIITNGRLATAGPGVLNINSEAVNNTLARGGPEVELMLSALKNFHYEKLTMKLEKKAGGIGRVKLHIRGKNPAVRNGQPFIINLNLTANVDRLAALAAQAFQLPSAVVRAMLPQQ